MPPILFKSYAEVKAYASTLHKLELATLQGYAYEAAELYLIPAMGRECFSWLLDAYHADAMDAAQQTLLPLVQRPLAFYTMLQVAPALSVHVGELGIMRPMGEQIISADDRTTSRLMESWLVSGDIFTDQLLAFLEANKSDYPVWAGSPSFTEFAGSILTTATEMSRFVNLQGSRRTFLALRPYLQRTQELRLQPILGPALYDELMSALASGSLTTEQKALVAKCKPYVANATVAEALPELMLQMAPSGLKVLTTTDGIFSRLQPSDTAVATLKNAHLANAETYRVYLVQFLEANALAYPLYPAAEAGTVPSSISLPVNDRSQKSFQF